MRYEWFEVKFEGDRYDVCVDTRWGFEVEEIRAHDSEINIIPVMSHGALRFFYQEAFKEHTKPRLSKEEGLPAGWRELKEMAEGL